MKKVICVVFIKTRLLPRNAHVQERTVDVSAHTFSKLQHVVRMGGKEFVGAFPRSNPFFCLFSCGVYLLQIDFIILR